MQLVEVEFIVCKGMSEENGLCMYLCLYLLHSESHILTGLQSSAYWVGLGSLVRLDFDFVCFRHLFVMIKDGIMC